ncbi:mucin-6-like [Cetorhinus maximus]
MGKVVSPYEFASKYQVDDPSETCHPLNPGRLEESYVDYVSDCSCMLNKVAPLCKLPKANYVTECQRDLYKCTAKGDTQCSCQTLSEYSRQCSRLLEPVTNWRNISFCPPTPCPGNQVYQECGSPCLSTCSNPQTICDSYGTYGCFCPEGTVLDDISAKDICVPLSHCPCVLNGQVYAPGGSVNSPCKSCTCFMGKWNCINLPCPGQCSLEGGSFVTTFDSKQYRFHGVCTYLLVKSVKMLDDGTIEAVFDKCGVRYSETQLTSIIYATNQTKIIISQQGTIEVNNKLTKLPYEDGMQNKLKMALRVCGAVVFDILSNNEAFDKVVDDDDEARAMDTKEQNLERSFQTFGNPIEMITVSRSSAKRNIAIYRQSSSYIQLKSTFGLEMQVQTHPFLQLYIIVDESFATTTHGLCGNFDRISQNDFRSSMGIQEGTASSFVDSWRVIEHCQYAQDKDCDPCSLSQSNNVKDQYYETLDATINRIPSIEGLYLLGDFNTMVGINYTAWAVCIGHLGIGKLNKNGQRLLEFCCYSSVMNSYFQSKPCYKVSWIYPRSCHWHQPDFIKTRCNTLNSVFITRSHHSADCDTDHSLARSKVRLQLRELYHSKKDCHWIKTSHTTDPERIQEFLNVLHQALSDNNTQSQCVVSKWDHLHNTIYNPAFTAYRKIDQRNADWFEARWNEMEPVTATKMKALMNYIQVPSKQNVDALRAARTMSQQTAWCKFETCNYEKSQDFMCNSLGVYARACAIKGLILTDWRNFVDECKISCQGLQVFSYDSKACNNTCFSRSNSTLECTESGVPVDGCNCAPDTFLDNTNVCVSASNCSCFLQDGVIIPAGNSVSAFDRTCICIRGKWECTGDAKCPSTCTVHGEGHITTFDGKQYVFDGSCEYTLVQDACSVNSKQPTFKIVSENIICGKTGVVCTKSIKIYFKDILIKLTDGHYQVTPPNAARRLKVINNPLYLKFDLRINAKLELTIIWNKNMNAYISITRLSELAVCGLCGNYNGNVDDEYITQNKYLVSNVLAFANSWKEDPTCRDVTEVVFPCHKNPYRLARAEKMCAIINSKLFEPCHKLVYRMPYYDNCVRDACGCELVGDCECLCDAVAVYAKTCIDAGVCIDWRTPEFCHCFSMRIHERNHAIISEYPYEVAKDVLAKDSEELLQKYPETGMIGPTTEPSSFVLEKPTDYSPPEKPTDYSPPEKPTDYYPTEEPTDYYTTGKKIPASE